MSNDTLIDDDYVATLLKRDAESLSSRSGKASAGSARPRPSGARPNARFLKNLVRDIDSHNTALKQKEERDARHRMWDHQRCMKKKERSRSPVSERRSRHHNHESRESRRSRSPRAKDAEKRRKRSLERYAPGSRRHRRARSGSRSPEYRSGRKELPRRESKRRRSPDSRPTDEVRHRARSKRHETDEAMGTDSDPLDGLIGPQPPRKSTARGRGAQNSASIDTHFKSTYDPKADVQLEDGDERDDWDMALEALRDRAKWKQSGAERLRAAGFTEAEISHWQDGKRVDGERDISDVKWSKKGGDREWDRGKVLEGEHVEQRPEWGRLKDT